MPEFKFPKPQFPMPENNQENGEPKSTTDSEIHLLNLFKHHNIRVFSYNDKYVLVNSGNNAFMIFQKLGDSTPNSLVPSICFIQYTFSMPVDKLPNAEQVKLSSISKPNLKFMTQCYLQAYPHKDQARNLKKKYHISLDFAQYVVKTVKGSMDKIEPICTDIIEARYYLKNNKSKVDWRNSLREGSNSEKLDILHELLSDETFKILNIYKMGKQMLDLVINEILRSK